MGCPGEHRPSSGQGREMALQAPLPGSGSAMPGSGGAPQAPARFEDVIVHFSREEWKILKDWQKELYWEVLRDTYETLLAAGGSPVTKSYVIDWFEQHEHQNLKGIQRSRNGDSSVSSCTPNNQLAKMCREECTEVVGRVTVVHDKPEEVTAQCGNVEGTTEELHVPGTLQKSPLRAKYLLHPECEKKIQELGRFAYSPKRVTVSKPFEHGGHSSMFRQKGLLQICRKISRKNVSFQCPKCEMGFPSNLHLRMHWRVHVHTGRNDRKTSSFLEPGQSLCPQESQAGEKLLLCVLCGKSFQRYLSFLQHQKTHEEAIPQPCVQCEVVCFFQNDLEIHEESHLEEALSEQATCGKNCICDISLQLHFASQLRKPGESSTSALQNQEQLHQKASCKLEKPYSCSQCEQRFSLEVNLEAHYRYHHKEWLQKHQLNDSVPNSLPQPEEVKPKQEPSGSAPSGGNIGFQNSGSPSCTLCSCSYCNKWFASKFSLRKHQERHNHGGAAKRDKKVGYTGLYGGPPLYRCRKCGKRFVHKWQLGKHMKGHAQEKQPLSSHCENILTQKADHGQHHQELTNKEAHRSGKCRQSTNEPALTLDQRQHAKEPLHACEECGKIFRRGYLPTHRAIHAGLRHKCLLCEKVFNFRSGAFHHLKRHWKQGDFAPCPEGNNCGSSRPCTCLIARIYVDPGQSQQTQQPQPSKGSSINSLPAENGLNLGSSTCLGDQPHIPSRHKEGDQDQPHSPSRHKEWDQDQPHSPSRHEGDQDQPHSPSRHEGDQDQPHSPSRHEGDQDQPHSPSRHEGDQDQPHSPSRHKQEDQAKHEQRCDWKSQLNQFQNTSPKQFKCPDCGSEFAHMAFLMMHCKMHKSKRYYQCTECGKKFISRFYLDLHRKRHVKESA